MSRCAASRSGKPTYAMRVTPESGGVSSSRATSAASGPSCAVREGVSGGAVLVCRSFLAWRSFIVAPSLPAPTAGASPFSFPERRLEPLGVQEGVGEVDEECQAHQPAHEILQLHCYPSRA